VGRYVGATGPSRPSIDEGLSAPDEDSCTGDWGNNVILDEESPHAVVSGAEGVARRPPEKVQSGTAPAGASIRHGACNKVRHGAWARQKRNMALREDSVDGVTGVLNTRTQKRRTIR
jgi:hypothetical protein